MLPFSAFESALPFDDFMARHGTPAYRDRWSRNKERLALTDAQTSLLGTFTRQMNVVGLAGAWCGDCALNCSIWEKIASAAPAIRLRYLDRDARPEVASELKINGGGRVPVLVVFSEDGHEVLRFGERTLSQYRELLANSVGEACSTGLVGAGGHAAAVQDWLEQFERAQIILRLSPRLRQKHGD